MVCLDVSDARGQAAFPGGPNTHLELFEELLVGGPEQILDQGEYILDRGWIWARYGIYRGY